MNRKKQIMEGYCLLLVDVIVIVISYMIAIKIRYQNFRWVMNAETHLLVCICFIMFGILYRFLIDWNREFLVRGKFVELMAVFKYNLFMIVAVSCFLFIMKRGDEFSRLVMGYYAIIHFILCLAMRVFMKKALKFYFMLEHNRVKIMVLANKSVIQNTVTRLKEKMDIDYEIVALGCLDEDLVGSEIQGIPITINRTNLRESAKQMALDNVFLNLPDENKSFAAELVSDLRLMGVECSYNIDFVPMEQGNIKVGTFCEYTVTVYSMHQIDYKRMLIKRLMDIVGGLIGSLITGAITPFIAIAIRIDSPGPVFFSQVRIGKNGRRFKIYKYRSMYQDAEFRKKELEEQNEMQGLMFKIENDPRITKVGKFLRKTSLDEFPQFYNIFRGDMSLVGTRPPTEDEFEKYNMYYKRRISMTPGLTGLWQVKGRSNVEDFEDVVKYDLEYIDKWSLGLDIKILLQTIGVVLFGLGAK